MRCVRGRAQQARFARPHSVGNRRRRPHLAIARGRAESASIAAPATELERPFVLFFLVRVADDAQTQTPETQIERISDPEARRLTSHNCIEGFCETLPIVIV